MLRVQSDLCMRVRFYTVRVIFVGEETIEGAATIALGDLGEGVVYCYCEVFFWAVGVVEGLYGFTEEVFLFLFLVKTAPHIALPMMKTVVANIMRFRRPRMLAVCPYNG